MIFFMIALQKVNPHIHICPGDQLSISAVKQAFGSLTWFFWKIGSFNKPPTSLPSCWRFCHPLKNSILRLRYWYYIISTVCVLYIYQVYIYIILWYIKRMFHVVHPPRLAVLLALQGLSPGVVACLGPVCSSWSIVNRGTTQRDFLLPRGDRRNTKVIQGNRMVARTPALKLWQFDFYL